MVALNQLQPGQKARLLSFADTPAFYRQRLLCMGLTPGVVVDLVRKAPLGCPVQINLRHTAISLRLDEVKNMQWERVE